MDNNLSVIFSHDLYIVFIYLYDVGLIIFVCIYRCCMFVLTRAHNCTCVCIMCLDNSFGVSTMNNTMYLHYVEQRLEGQDKFERSNINSISAIPRVHAEVLKVAKKGI